MTGRGRLHKNKGSPILRQVDLLTLQQDNKIKDFHPPLLLHYNLSVISLLYCSIDVTLEWLPLDKKS